MNVSQSEFKYMVEGITADLIELLMDREHIDFPTAFSVVYNSDTYQTILRPETLLYYQSPGYVYQFLDKELKTGKI